MYLYGLGENVSYRTSGREGRVWVLEDYLHLRAYGTHLRGFVVGYILAVKNYLTAAGGVKL